MISYATEAAKRVFICKFNLKLRKSRSHSRPDKFSGFRYSQIRQYHFALMTQKLALGELSG